MSDKEAPNTESAAARPISPKDAIPRTTADDLAQAPRKRARRACLYCRARKVRCDVSLVTPPCTNCKLDKRDCVVKPRARKWPCTQSQTQVFQQSSLEQHTELAEDRATATPDLLPAETCGEAQSDRGLSEDHFDEAAPVIDDGILEGLGASASPSSPEPPRYPPVTFTNTDYRVGATDNGPLQSRARKSHLERDYRPIRLSLLKSADRRHGNFVPFLCYPFIQTDSLRRLPPQDIAFLQQRGCFHLPAKPAVEEFVSEYFLHVHPILPLLNEADFWQIVSDGGSPALERRRIPLFLFQTMLFIACPFVSPRTLRSIGFSSVQTARAEFYSRAKTLFDMDIYHDDVTCAQGALMLTYHAPSANDRTNTYWLNTAVHFARNARADQYSLMDDESEKSVLKRLWWCCILRDRIMALGLRRPLCIRPSDFDFKLPYFTENDFADEVRNSKVYNSATKQVLVQLAISLCELGVVLGEILDIVYPVKTTVFNYCEQSHKSLKSSSALLDTWYEKAVAKYLIPTHISGAHSSLILFTDMIYVYYFVAKAAICNHMMLFSVTGPQIDGLQVDDRLHAHAQVDESLRNITDILVELQQLGLSKYLPNTFIAFSAFPFAWRILDAKVISSGNRSDAVRQDLETYAEVMNGFRVLYESTDSVLQCIEKIVDYVRQNETLQLLYSDTPTSEHWFDNSRVTSPETTVQQANSWKHLLKGDPYSYLRIFLTVEFSLFRGQFPSENDFPKALQTLQRDNNYIKDYQILTDLNDGEFSNLLELVFEAGRGA